MADNAAPAPASPEGQPKQEAAVRTEMQLLTDLEREVYAKLRQVEQKVDTEERKYIELTTKSEGSVGNLMAGWDALEGKAIDKRKANDRMFSESSETWKFTKRELDRKREEQATQEARARQAQMQANSAAYQQQQQRPVQAYQQKPGPVNRPSQGAAGVPGKQVSRMANVMTAGAPNPHAAALKNMATAIPASGFMAPAAGAKRPRDEGATPGAGGYTPAGQGQEDGFGEEDGQNVPMTESGLPSSSPPSGTPLPNGMEDAAGAARASTRARAKATAKA